MPEAAAATYTREVTKAVDIAALNALPGLARALRQLLEREAARLDFGGHVALEVDSLDQILAFVAKGHGQTILPRAPVEADVAAARLWLRRLQEARFIVPFCLARNLTRAATHASVVNEDLNARLMLELIDGGLGMRTRKKASDDPASPTNDARQIGPSPGCNARNTPDGLTFAGDGRSVEPHETRSERERKMAGHQERRVAIVTGGARGLGRAIAEALVAQGVQLLLVDILADRLEETQSAIKAAGGTCAILETDISRRENCIAAVDAAMAAYGRLDVLINSAGLMRFNHVGDVPEDEFNRIMQVNAGAPFWLAQAAIPHLLETQGNIVNVLSQSALIGTSYIVPYSMSKAALLQMTKSLAVEFVDKPIRINAVAPGSMMTEISAEAQMPDGIDFAKIKRYSGERPPSDPAVVAAVVAFISSPAASGVHGAVWTADNGVTAG